MCIVYMCVCKGQLTLQAAIRLKSQVRDRKQGSETPPGQFIMSEMEWQVASPLTKSCCPLVFCCPSPGLIWLASLFLYWSPLCPINPGSRSHKSGPQTPLSERYVSMCIALDLEGVSASINTAPAEGDTCK